MNALTLKQINELVLLIYRAGADPDLWPEFMEKLDSAIGCAHLTIYGHDTLTGLALGEITSRFEDDAMGLYRAHFHTVNPFPQIMKDMKTNDIRATYDMVDRDKFLGGEFYNDFLKPQGNIGGGGGGALLNDDGRLLIVAGHVPMKEEEAKTHFLVDTLRVLAPHMSQAFQMQRAMQSVKLKNDALEQSLDQVDNLIFIIGKDGKITFSNKAATAALIDQDYLVSCRRNSIVFRDRNANTKYSQILNDFSLGRFAKRPKPFSVRIKDQQLAMATLYPLCNYFDENIKDQNSTHFRFQDTTGISLLSISGHCASEKNTSELLREVFELTPAEQLVALAIAGGASLSEFAEYKNISINTAKTQLRSVFEKTGTTRQNQLVALVWGLS